MITDSDAVRMATAGRRLRAALNPADDVEQHTLELVVQVLAWHVLEQLADMAERRAAFQVVDP